MNRARIPLYGIATMLETEADRLLGVGGLRMMKSERELNSEQFDQVPLSQFPPGADLNRTALPTRRFS